MIVDSDLHPEKNIFFTSAMILDQLSKVKTRNVEIFELFNLYNKNNISKISFDYLLLSLDWLFLLGLIDLDAKGNIVYVSP